MTAIVTQGDAANLYLPDESVDTVVCSPPYFGLRSYQDGGEHYDGQVGDEATPAEYLDALIACTAEWMRVLKPGGSIFCNLGDKYAAHQTGHRPNETPHDKGGRASTYRKGAGQWKHETIRQKSLIGLPWRYAIRCIDELGLILRAEIIWSKPNGLPESVTDRVRRSHESVFHLVKQPRYYSAVDSIREPAASGGAGPRGFAVVGRPAANSEPLGKLPSSVWEIPTSPLRVPESLGIDHFAAFPSELVRRIVLGWSPRDVCTACGEGRRPVTETTLTADRGGRTSQRISSAVAGGPVGSLGRERFVSVTGYACVCPDTSAPTTPGVCLDPFGGTGTTALVASAYGRVGISVDLSADYCRLAQWRTADPGERARVLGVPKPEPVPEGQLGMFDGLGA
jgi:DNA modification methylase